MAQPAGAAAGPAGPARRRAVVVIHGIGEQRPMETLRGFVNAVLGPPAPPPAGEPARPRYYSKPDTIAEGYELRRLVVAEGGRRTDYYEFYWAHLMPIAVFDRLTAWFWMLLVRSPGDVPRRFRLFWWLSWIGILVAIVLGVLTAISFFRGIEQEQSSFAKLPWSLVLVVGSLTLLVRAYVGDAAVYLSPNPRNVEARNRIREAATALLRKLHGSGRYERIVIVGHSLGSVIGYDMLTYAWQRESDRLRTAAAARDPADPLPRARARWRSEEVAQKVTAGTAGPDAWNAAVPALLAEQQAEGSSWAVTDFVTLGSPLAHGDLLLARNRGDFRRRVQESELPTSPPVLEHGRRFSFKVYPKGGRLAPQRPGASPCGAVRGDPMDEHLFSEPHIALGRFRGRASRAAVRPRRERCLGINPPLGRLLRPCKLLGGRSPRCRPAWRAGGGASAGADLALSCAQLA